MIVDHVVPRVYDCKDSTRAIMKQRRYVSSDSDDESQGDASEERLVVMGSDYESQGDGSEDRAVVMVHKQNLINNEDLTKDTSRLSIR